MCSEEAEDSRGERQRLKRNKLFQLKLVPLFYLLNSSLDAEWCPTLCDPMDSSTPGSSVHSIPQARLLAWVAIPFSSRSSRLGDQTQVSYVSCIAGRFFTSEHNTTPLQTSTSSPVETLQPVQIFPKDHMKTDSKVLYSIHCLGT